ncbi:MAG: coproporphyrinogen dehydrogenase HemZ [Acetivibrionales bacterium]
MVFVKNSSDYLRYEIEDVLRLFYSTENIIFTDNAPPPRFCGAFFIIEELGTETAPEFRIVLKTDKIELTKTVSSDMVQAQIDINEKRRVLKREIKRVIYMLFSELTGKKLPWGVLTGIRPGKIVLEMMECGLGREEVLERLQNYYFISYGKAVLLYGIAKVERSVLKKSPDNTVSVYIGIPFCPTRCLYCSFTSYPINKCLHLTSKYLDALKTEISRVGEIIDRKKYKIQSVYIGGGTPTSLDAQSLASLFKHIEGSFDLGNIEEYTVEAGRPDSFNAEKLEVIKDSRASRISINPQTMNDKTLKLIGRNHTAVDIIEKYYLARKVGFKNINMDIIVGLPGENLDMFANTLMQIKKLEPESLTVHTMSVKRASRLNENKKEYDFITSEEASAMVDMAYETAGSMGMHPYYLYRQKNMLGNLENIGYCKPGFESIYNVQIMEEKQTIIALGAGAVTKVVYLDENRIERAFNVKNVEEYINRVNEMIERKNMLLTTLSCLKSN